MTYTKNLPASLSKMWKPMWFASLGLHGLLLIIPIPSAEIPQPLKKPQQLVSLTPVTPPPSPKIRAAKTTPVATNRPKIQQQRIFATKPTPPTTAKKSPRPVVAPSPQTKITKPAAPTATNPLPQPTELELDTKNQELLPPPQVIPSVAPSPIAVGSPNPGTIATDTINGVPVDPNWQAVEHPSEVIAEAQMFTQPDGKLNPDIVGKVAQIPDKKPDIVFKEFFRLQLAITNFTVEPRGTYVAGGGLYKLTPKGSSSPLYLTLVPNKQGTGTIVTIWNKYPSPVESNNN